MELHAWVWIFAAANQGHNTLLKLPRNYLGPVLSRHPDWINKSRNGDSFDHGLHNKKAFFDPANPQARQYLLSLLDEIASNYDVDGIQLDYIRYPFQSRKLNSMFGYGKSSRWEFKQRTGVDPIKLTPSSRLWKQWLNFRIHQIDSFVETASTMLKQKRPDLLLSAAVFPYPQQERLSEIQQNWEEWGRKGWVDLLAVMTYAMDTDSLEEKTQPLLEQPSAGSALVVPGIRIHKVPDPVIADQVQLMRNLPTLGYALFAVEGFKNNPNFQEILNRTQGSIIENKTQPIPYRQPFKAAAWRYHTLQSEWSLLLKDRTPEQWKAHAEEISVLLQELSKMPTIEKVKQVQDRLEEFNQNFSLWLKDQQGVSDQQMEFWQSRLASITRLVNYGQRTVLTENRFQLGANR
jgi:uncharacterized lipoprotein YddW (UPF0748 family)